ncbi:MAG: hypothetical protein JJU27_19485 [Gammaproteobacteria bacterium]|nr:hypothetical protein [Gammaproteobacteria bacterium]
MTGLVILEFIFVPGYVTRDVDRDLALMGFYAPPGVLVDDTRINADGFTGHESSEITRASNTTKILTLGGSTMFNRRMTERMIDSWGNLFPAPPQVLGAALRTHTTRASVIKYEYHFSKLPFDYVLIYHSINDLWANNFSQDDFRSDFSHQNPWGRRTLLLDNLMLARLAYNSRHSSHGTFPEISNEAGFMAEVSFEANLRALVGAVRANGGTPILMTFAWHIPENYSLDAFLSGELAYNNPTRYDYCPVELWGEVAYVEQALQRHNTIIRRLATTLDVDLIDQHESLSRDPENFGDPVHFSEPGTDRFIANLTDYFLHTQGRPRNH